MTKPQNDSTARYAHGPEIAARLTAWLEEARREVQADSTAVADELVIA